MTAEKGPILCLSNTKGAPRSVAKCLLLAMHFKHKQCSRTFGEGTPGACQKPMPGANTLGPKAPGRRLGREEGGKVRYYSLII